MTRNQKSLIQVQNYELPNSFAITNEILKSYISLFWQDVFTPLYNKNNNIHLLILCKVGFKGSNAFEYRTIADLRSVNFSDQDLFGAYLIERLGILVDSYSVNNYDKIEFTYIVKDGQADGNRQLLQPANYEITKHNFNNIKLPLTMNPSEYGVIIGTSDLDNGGIRYIVRTDIKIFSIEVRGNINKVRIEGAADLTWVDTKVSDDTFRRELGKNTMWVKNGEIIVREKQLNAKPIKTIKCDKKLSSSSEFMTMDIECMNIQGELLPYLVCAYNKENYIKSILTNIKDPSERIHMFKAFIAKLMSIKALKYVYAHNLSGFDGIILLRYLMLIKGAKTDPMIYNGKLICINFTFDQDGKKRVIVFKDSYLMLPLSLRKLCENFNITTPKTYFPHLLDDLSYVGPVPHISFWKDITPTEYHKIQSNFTNKEWSFREEAIKYCKIDCVSLFEIIVQFNELIFEHFNINIHKALTLPSLAMRIFKSQFMPENTLFQIGGKVENDIRQAYTGGHVDVYKPHNHVNGDITNKEHNTLYYYDANSLYAYIMSKLPVPCGKPIAFLGNIREVLPNAYGCFYCTITSPANMENPILQRKVRTKDGIRTVAGLGTWDGWINSLEMDGAIRYGYTFVIHNGYRFKSKVVFKEYVEKMYELRLQHPKGSPMNLIAKLLMNSLYGKYGFKTEKFVIKTFNKDSQVDITRLHNMWQ